MLSAAPPGYPKINLTPSSLRARISRSPPESFMYSRYLLLSKGFYTLIVSKNKFFADLKGFAGLLHLFDQRFHIVGNLCLKFKKTSPFNSRKSYFRSMQCLSRKTLYMLY